MAFIVNIVAKFIKIHPATVQTKTFAAGIAAIGSCVVGLCTMVYNGDQNVLDYVAAVGAGLIAAGQIFHRDAITKIGNTIQNILSK